MRLSFDVGRRPLGDPAHDLLGRRVDHLEGAVAGVDDAGVNVLAEELGGAGGAVAYDDDVDALYNQVYRELISYILEDPKVIEQANQLMWAAHNLERTADRVINICERTVYAVTGELTELDTDETGIESLG